MLQAVRCLTSVILQWILYTARAAAAGTLRTIRRALFSANSNTNGNAFNEASGRLPLSHL
jgi:hypothetical protein